MNDFTHAVAAALALIGRLDPELLGIVLLSLRVSLSASLIVLANALLGLPPVVAGLVIYLLLSRSGPLGFAGLLFTPSAMVIAQVVLTTPIVIALVHRPASLLWAEYADLARTDGLSPLRSMMLLISLGRASLLTAFLAAFGRAIAEVGAIIIVGGNIRGYTRTMTTTIALETSKGELSLALALGIILVALSVTISTVAFVLVGRTGEK